MIICLNLVINPITGSIIWCFKWFWYYKITDGGESFSASLGGLNDHYYSDIAIKSDGTLVAVLSSQTIIRHIQIILLEFINLQMMEIHGQILHQQDFQNRHERSVIACSDLATPIFYVLTFTGEYFSATNSNGEAYDNETITLFKLSTDNSVTEDLSANLPSFHSIL